MRKDSYDDINAKEKENLLIEAEKTFPDKKRKKHFHEKGSCLSCILPLLRMLLNIKKVITKQNPIDTASSIDSLESDTSFVNKSDQQIADLNNPNFVFRTPNFSPAITIGYFMQTSTNFRWVPIRYSNGARVMVKSSNTVVPWMVMNFYNNHLLTLVVSNATNGNCYFLRGKANGKIRLMVSLPNTDLFLGNCLFSLVYSHHRHVTLMKHNKTNLYLSENPRWKCLYLTSNEQNASVWSFRKLNS